MPEENTAGKAPLIEFTDAEIMNGETPVLYNLNMKIFPGELVYIVGRVGSGKTSIIRTITAENRLGGGSGTVCGYSLEKLRSRDIPMLRRRLGIIFQDFQLLMDRSVADNLDFVLRCTGCKDRQQRQEKIEKALEAVGMSGKSHKMPHQLSGGEQQRIAIARALLNRPEVIIADEPTGNLDSDTADGIMKLLMDINSEGTAIVMVTHNRSIFERYHGRVLLCENESCTEQAASDIIDFTV